MRFKTSFGTLASKAEYRPEHYRFVRTHSGEAPEPLPALTSYGVELARLAGVAALVAVLWFLAVVLS